MVQRCPCALRQGWAVEEHAVAIGFEFATNWQIYKDRPILPGQNNPPRFGKGFALKRTSGWDMTVDGREIEFVVKPVEEDANGEGNVRNRLQSLARFVNEMNLKNDQTQLHNGDFVGHLPAQPRFVIYNQHANQPIDAIPQVSAGVLLSRYQKLVSVLADPNKAARTRFFSNDARVANAYSREFAELDLPPAAFPDPNWPAHTPSAKLRGLATLIATYIKRGHPPSPNSAVSAVKYRTIVMARTNFAAIFNTLSHAEKDHYKHNTGQWVDYICTGVMSHVPPFDATNGADPDHRLIGFKITDQQLLADGQRVTLPITRRKWLVGMTRGRDLLSAAAHEIGRLHPINNPIYRDTAGVGHRLRGLGGLGHRYDTISTPHGPQLGVIFEFRARQDPVRWDQWEDYGLRMYRFFRDLNELADNAAVDYV